MDLNRLMGLTVVVALALPSSVIGQADTPQSQRPAIGVGGPLTVAEIRWCMSQEVGLEAIQPRLGTRDAIDRYNELAYEFNRRCNRAYSRSDGAEAMRLIDSARGEIVGAAIDDIQRHNDSALTRNIQELLQLVGYEPGAIDGLYGTQTKAAIEAFQQKVGYPVDGLLSEKLLGRLQVENMRRLTGRETAAVVSVAVLVTEEAQGGESDAEPVADAQVILSGDQGFHLDQQTDERGRVELGRLRAGQVDIEVRRNGERFRSTFQVTEDPLQEFWIALPAPVPEDP